MKFKFENLDSIRTLAFLSTFLAHAFYTESVQVKSSTSFQWAIQFQEIFSFGVPIFFVLSGFLITYLMLKEQDEFGTFNLKNFYLRRILRIWPVYFFVLIIGFVLFPIIRSYIMKDSYIESANSIYYILFLSNFDQIAHTTLPFGIGLGPTWSVSIEEQFYVVWPLFLLFFKKKSFIWAIVLVLLATLVLTPLLGFPSKHSVFCMMYLSVGGFAAYLAYYYQSFILKITRIHPVFFLTVIILLIVSIYFASLGIANFFLITAIAFLIAYIILFQCYAGKLNLKRIPFLETTGKYTYGLYLYHVICNFIAHVAIDDILKIQETELTVVFIKPIISLGLSLLLSLISYHYYEKYFLKLKTRFSSNH